MRQTATADAPGRVNLIGEHTDYNDGFALPMALGLRCRATVAVRDGGELTVRSAQHPEPARIPLTELRPGAEWLHGPRAWAAYAAGVVWALRDRVDHLPGLDMELDSTVPLGSGLSSSAAVCCSVALALDRLFQLDLDRRELVAVTRTAENDLVGAPTGGMDQLVSLLGTAGHALLCDMRSLATEQIPFDPQAAGLALVLIDSRVRHSNADGAYGDRRAACEQAARELGVPALRDVAVTELDDVLARLSSDELRRRVRHVVTEDDRVLRTAELLKAGAIDAVGPLLTASHRSMRDMFEITTTEIDTAVDTLLLAGALGARMTGGGFGGHVLALVPADRVDAAVHAVARRFHAAGFAEPSWVIADAADGAR